MSNGSVKRGVISSKRKRLDVLIESSIEMKGNKIIASPLDGKESFDISKDTLVSMNMLALRPNIFDYISNKIDEFFKDNKDNLEKCEFLIPDILDQINREDITKVKVIDTEAVWYGVTYKEDTEGVRSAIKSLVENGDYPNNLWE